MSFADLFRRASDGPDFGADGVVLPGARALVDVATARAVQSALNARGARLAVDGSWGPLSAAGLAAFQSSAGLKADGVPGPDTLRALNIPIPTPPRVPNIPGLKKSVIQALPVFNGKFEGQALPYMYTDVKGLVTTGTGNLIDPISEALKLPWKNADGSAASPDQVTAAFNAVKGAWPGVQSTASQSLTSIRLTPDDLNSLLYGKIAQNHAFLANRYPNLNQAPADAQLALHSLSWAWGPAFSRVWGALGAAFDQAFKAGNFGALPDIVAQASAHEESINAGIRPRNAATKELFQNAADVVAKKADPDALFWPGPVLAGVVKTTNIVAWVIGGATLAGLLVALATGEFKR